MKLNHVHFSKHNGKNQIIEKKKENLENIQTHKDETVYSWVKMDHRKIKRKFKKFLEMTKTQHIETYGIQQK